MQTGIQEYIYMEKSGDSLAINDILNFAIDEYFLFVDSDDCAYKVVIKYATESVADVVM